MEFVGKYLKKTRLKKRLKIDKISDELKIGKETLQNIENDYFYGDLNIVYLLGHIRSYAKYLKLNEDQVIDDLKIQISYNNKISAKEISKPIHNKFFFNTPKFISFASITFVSFAFYFLFIKSNDFQNNYAITPDLPENLNYILEESAMNILSLNNKKINSGEIYTKIEQEFFLLENSQNNFFNSSSAKASLLNKNIDSTDKKITLRFLNSTWIQLRNKNDEIILSKLMNQGDEYSYNLSQNLNLTAGNAGNILISLNGVVKGKAGKVGEVIDSLTIDNNFKN